MRSRILAVGALFLASAAAQPAPVPAPAPASLAASDIRLVDLTDEFDEIWARDRERPDAERASRLREAFAQLLPGFYSAERVGASAERYDRHLIRSLAAYPGQRAMIADVSRRFAAMIAPARQSFEAQFGPFPQSQTVYLINSLGEMDGGMRELGGRAFLIFGADMIGTLHGSHDVQPFFHHELFHLHHSAFFSGCDQVWCSLWSEGLATYVSHRLNPSATDAEMLLSVPEPIRPAVDANRQEAICAVVERLQSSERPALSALFSFQRLNPRLPPRFGYYVGYLAAAELGRTRSLQALERMPSSEVRPLLEATLRQLANGCPEAPPQG